MKYVACTTNSQLKYDLSQRTLESLTDSLVFYSSYDTEEEKQELVERSIRFLKVIGSISDRLSKDPVNSQSSEVLYIAILQTGIRTFFNIAFKEYSSRTDEFAHEMEVLVGKFLQDYKRIKGRLFLVK